MLTRLIALGNRLPDPVALFAMLAGAVAVLSQALAGWSAVHPGTGELVVVQGLCDRAGLQRMLTEAVKNFAAFPPLGTVLVAMLGIGVAERSGLVDALIRGALHGVSPRLLTAALVFVGVNASIASDAGFVVLVPLGATLYARVGRHPLAGLATAYAAVSGGYGANLVVTALDPLLAGLTEAAARIVDPSASVPATCNWWFNAASVPMLTAVGTAVSLRTEPAFGPWQAVATEECAVPGGLGRALLAAAGVLATVGVLVATGVLRDSAGGFGPFYAAIVPLVAALFLVPGVVFGWSTGRFRSTAAVADAMADAMAAMAPYIVLAFAAAQFVAWFSWSNLGIVLAVHGADALRALGLPALVLLVLFVMLSGAVNLVIASASAKWAIMAPVFVPMLMLLGMPPAQVQAGYRVGDAFTNILTPLLPYVPITLSAARRWVPGTGMGTVLGAQVPYAIAFGVAWTAMLVGWVALEWPLGAG